MALRTRLWIHGVFGKDSVSTITEYKLLHGGVKRLDSLTHTIPQVTKVETNGDVGIW